MNSRILYFLYSQKNQRKKFFQYNPPSDSSSIADVAFLLLIFFIVTSSFFVPQGLVLELPSKKAKPSSVKENKIVEVYPKENSYQINEVNYNGQEFNALLQKRISKNPELALVVYMESSIPYKRLIDTLSIAKKNKIYKLTLKDSS